MQPDFRHARSGSLSIGAQNGHPGPQQQGQQGQPGQPGQQGSQQGQGQGPHDATSPMPGAQARFDGPRSPPNTSHVPCKFFRQGACQAGNSCPFSHDIGTAIETVCKYFAKGNCKFGPKCANMHLLPDGRRVTYSKNGVIIGTAPVNHAHGPGQNSHLPGLGHRVNPAAYMQPSNSALTNSFLNASSQPLSQASPQPQPQPQPQPPSDDRYDVHAADASYASNPTSAYGSPPGAGGAGFDELHALAGNGTSSLGQALRQAQQGGQTPQQQHRSLLGLSPMNANVLSVMDAPLPASFDSNGISHAARYGPWPSSVPSKFGLESPTPSLHNAKDERTSETLKMLHTSAFGDHLSPSSLLPAQQHGSHQHSSHHLAAAAAATGTPGTGTAAHHPKTASLLNGAALDDFGGKRILHSSSTRYAKPRLLSSSVPKVDRDWDTEFWFLEEDYVPANLANEVLTPQEKARRGSLRLTEPSGHALEGGSNNHNNQNHSDTPTPSASATKFGSPAGGGVGVAGSSPSRWSPWLQQRQRSSGAPLPLPASSYGAGGAGGPVDDDFEPGSVGRSMKHAASAFGHVGSPLRNSLAGGGSGSGRHSADVHGGSTSSINGGGGSEFGHSLSGSLGGRGGGSGFGFGSGAGGGDRTSMSVLSQQLQRTRLEGEDEDDGDNNDDSTAVSGQNAPPRPSSTSSSSTPSRLRPAAAARNPSASLSQAAVTQAAAAGIIGSSSGGGGGGGGGRFPAPIDEEDPSFLFDMEVADDSKLKNGTAAVAAASTGGPTSPSAATPATNSLWGYANIVKGGTGGPAKGGEATSR
ncbi:spindle poison sensitivity protein [Sporothrix brasiliensis 5110]|uniref:Spindle poison sensitivity protein n=1 Tax=Sporothrix brasiliensis 5110 TaxID=1398154 RepID=A0A0C2F3A6_9PEZI|nr:spindle poison sensitivity protein [Sporothrix brasiliensis 5110]KIH93374.1 spindle poison sensitivity protein [Sporothrix brasiliensis 5110]